MSRWTDSEPGRVRERRSWLFVPADDEHKVAKALAGDSDAVILDLEDSVVPDRLRLARGAVEEIAGQRRSTPPEVWVRINPMVTDAALIDLAAAIRPGVTGVMVPKVRSPNEVIRLHHIIDGLEAREHIDGGKVGIAVVATETPEAVLRLRDMIGASDRLVACTWGAEDLSTALGASTNRGPEGDWDEPYLLVRSLCLLTARAVGAQPVDTLHAAFTDDEGLRASVRQAARQGFTGKIAIHPQQVPIINEGFTPTDTDVQAARAVVTAFAARPDAGAVPLDGRMVDRPHLTHARRVLDRAGHSTAEET